MGSASELEYHLLLAKELERLQVSDYLRLETDVCTQKVRPKRNSFFYV
jgi:hypothetical protein